jgi:hypothetical protein
MVAMVTPVLKLHPYGSCREEPQGPQLAPPPAVCFPEYQLAEARNGLLLVPSRDQLDAASCGISCAGLVSMFVERSAMIHYIDVLVS